MPQDPLRCFLEWELPTHFTYKESEAQRSEETAPCNFSAASQVLSKVGGYGARRESWAGSGWGEARWEGDSVQLGDRSTPSLELSLSHTHTQSRMLCCAGRNPGPEIAMSPSEAEPLSLLCLGLGRRLTRGEAAIIQDCTKQECMHTPSYMHPLTSAQTHTCMRDGRDKLPMPPSWPPEGPGKVGPEPGTFLLQLCNEALHSTPQQGLGVCTEDWMSASS